MVILGTVIKKTESVQGAKDYKIYFLQTGIVLEQGGRSVGYRTDCWLFVRRLTGSKDYRDQSLDLFLT